METEKISFPSASRSSPAIRARRSAIRRSRGVVVGDLNITVSLTMAAAMSPASRSPGRSPASWYMVAMMVLEEPTGSLRTKTGYPVSTSPSRWWSMIPAISACSSPGTDWAFSLWSTSTTRLRLGRIRW